MSKTLFTMNQESQMREGGGVGSYPLDWCVYARGWSFYWCGSFYSEMTSFSFSLISCSISAVDLLLLTVTFTLDSCGYLGVV